MKQYKTIIIYAVSGIEQKLNWKNTDWSDWESKTSSHFP